MYLILMNPEDNKITYQGAITIINGKPWYVTDKVKPAFFDDENEANKMIKKLQKSRPKDEFLSMPVEAYLIITEDWDSEWLKEMRQEQTELTKTE